MAITTKAALKTQSNAANTTNGVGANSAAGIRALNDNIIDTMAVTGEWVQQTDIITSQFTGTDVVLYTKDCVDYVIFDLTYKNDSAATGFSTLGVPSQPPLSTGLGIGAGPGASPILSVGSYQINVIASERPNGGTTLYVNKVTSVPVGTTISLRFMLPRMR